MKTKWAKDHNGVDAVEDGCELSEEETKLLIRLAGTLSHGLLLKEGFTSDEALTILRWHHAI